MVDDAITRDDLMVRRGERPRRRTPLPSSALACGGAGRHGGEPVGFELADGSDLTLSVMASAFFDTYHQSICRSMSGERYCWPVDASVEIVPLPWINLELAGNNDMVVWFGLPTSARRWSSPMVTT